MDEVEPVSVARTLGAALRQHRMAKGMSLRALAKEIGLSGHGTLVDYEHGRRIPPEDLLVSCEKVLDLDDGTLRRLRLEALAERAGTRSAALLSTPAEAPPPDPAPAPGPRPRWRYLVPALVVVLAAAAGGVWLAGQDSDEQPPPPRVDTLRFGFEGPEAEWEILWGGHKATAGITTERHYEGSHSFQVISVGRSAEGPEENTGYVGFGTDDRETLATLHAGMRVTMKLWVLHPHDGFQFIVRNENGDDVKSLETPTDGAEMPIKPGPDGWATVTWTVPDVKKVTALVLQPYQSDGTSRTFAVDAVSW
ncbi:helix-turn-helix domain-containing protein [Actinophytocola sediminis]